MDYTKSRGYLHPMYFVDDGISGTTFQRPAFQRMEAMIENGEIGTVIVKDLSRFGRNHIETGRYLEMVYPSLGVKFIAIQENIDTLEGTGTEMMPFHNIFNEWYASQTSKKVRAVWAMKAANGQRTNFNVPFGYKRDPEDQEKWLIDEPAAEVVRKIFSLCIGGKGPSQIARYLEDEKVLTPCAYYHSIGRKANHPVPKNPYGWRDTSIEQILANRVYTGCTVNLKTTTVSYKVHKMIRKPEEDWVIIPNTQEAIGGLADFVRCYESVFLYLVAKTSTADRKREMKELQLSIEAGRRRIDELDRLISRIYEDNAIGRISDDRYERMSAGYEKEQHDLMVSVAENERRLHEMEKERVDLHMLLKGLREFTEIRELTPELVNTLIQRIEIHNSDRSSGHVRVKVDIYFTAVGMIDLPTEEDLSSLIAEIQENGIGA